MIDRAVLLPVARSRGRVRLVTGQEATLLGVRESYARVEFDGTPPRGRTIRRGEITAILPPE